MSDETAPDALNDAEQSRWEGEPEEAIGGFRDAEPFEIEAQGHSIVFYPAGGDRLAALVQMIESAEQSLSLVFYIFQPDGAGEVIRDALAKAAARGVFVHLIVDAFGSDAPVSFFDPLVEAGGRFDRFSPRWNVRYLIRNHQKFMIADGKRVMTGGFNVADDYFSPPDEDGWCDLGATVEGPVVERFEAWFGQLVSWVSNDRAQFRAIQRMLRGWKLDDGPVQLVLGGPTRIASSWARSVISDLAEGERLDLVMAYFSPSAAICELIERIGSRGGARLIMAGKSDNDATIGASRSLYAPLIESGVKIAEFQPARLHMKLLVIDDVSYFGSANMDRRSMRLNLELMLRIKDRDLANRMRQMIDHLAQASDPIEVEWLNRKATWFNRLRWKLSYWLVSVVDYTVTRRLNLGQ